MQERLIYCFHHDSPAKIGQIIKSLSAKIVFKESQTAPSKVALDAKKPPSGSTPDAGKLL